MKLFKKFTSNTDGNIAVIAAIASLTLVTAAGFAVDSARILQSQAELQDLNDVVALTVITADNAALETRRDDFQVIMEQEISTRSNLFGLEFDLNTDESQGGIILDVTSRSEVNLFFSGLWGEKRYVEAQSEVVISNQTLEIALVLDISSSMNDARLNELQNASKSLITTLLTNEALTNKVSISLVPFGGTVRLPDELESMLIAPPTTNDWVDGEWNGCFSMTPQDYQNGIWPGDRFNYMPHYYAFGNNVDNPWCPTAGNELIALTNNQTTLFNTIDNFQRSDGTGTDIAVAWGLATIDPSWRDGFVRSVGRTPRPFNRETRKIMIVMSDGGITGQLYPSANTLATGVLPYQATETIASSLETQTGYEGLCDRAKSNGVEIYTIGFSIDNQNQENRFKRCATSEATHFSVEEGQLNGIFTDIALTVEPIRLSR